MFAAGITLGMKDADRPELASPSYSPRTPTPQEAATDPHDSYLDVDTSYPDMEPELPDDWEELLAESDKLSCTTAMSENMREQRGVGRNAEMKEMEQHASVVRRTHGYESRKPEDQVHGSAGGSASVSDADTVPAKASLPVEGGGADEDSDLEEGEIRE